MNVNYFLNVQLQISFTLLQCSKLNFFIFIGYTKPSRVVEQIAVNIATAGVPGGSGLMRKRKTLKMAVYREQKKVKGTTDFSNIADVEDIKAKLPLKYQVNYNNLTYLEYFGAAIERR